MKRNNKLWQSLGLTMLAGMLLLAGCGNKENTEASGSPASPSTASLGGKRGGISGDVAESNASTGLDSEYEPYGLVCGERSRLVEKAWLGRRNHSSAGSWS